ncbi:GerAB/ArcD/ProY family transporter [Alkalihalobacillus macyae]|uniref:GerAB/ArcD/ProY family transporter n=1 Tax=Guptibacillus hwajinpoensis TaxID=208199 RepID=UPI00273AF624|nr:GerAB/ArcD/ProY family transporter [Alkalihalobacillus macyae]MDP4551151.1 GerAB/ArcD/ProY family transporter [Alkalihalobacillus macyae]
MEKAKISPIQLFALIFLFELGSAIVVALGIDAGKDAWLSILLGLCGGILLFFMYRYLFLMYPNIPLTGYVRVIFGKYIGWLIGLLYCLYFLYIAARVLRDFGDLMLSSTLSKTPLLPINALFVVAIAYVVYQGIEVLGRTAEVFIVIMVSLGLLGNAFIYISGTVDIHNLMPVFENGWKPVLKTIFPETLTVPFGEMIVFTMLFPYLNKPKMMTKTVLSGMVLSGLALSYTLALNISVLGVDKVGRSTFPLLSTIGMVDVADFLQRLDAIVVFTLIIGGFFKITIFFYAGVIGIVDLFKFEKHSQILVPISLILLYSSMAIASNFSEHIEEGLEVFLLFGHVPFQIAIPLLLCLTAFVRSRLKAS